MWQANGKSPLTSWIPKENKTALFNAVTINRISFILNISYVVSEYRPDKWISHTDSVKQLCFSFEVFKNLLISAERLETEICKKKSKSE